MKDAWSERQKAQVQRLALSGHVFDASYHFVLKVEDAAAACRFLGRVQDLVAFGERERGRAEGEADREPCVSIGFTYRGLQALDVPDRYLQELRTKAAAFCEGAPARAALRLGDSGPSAVERWEPIYRSDRAHVLILIHGPSEGAVDSTARRLEADVDAMKGLAGWGEPMKANQLNPDPKNRTVHFGFRDNMAIPRIVEHDFDRFTQLRHRAGELVLGYENDERFNRWDDDLTASDVADFFRNCSFAALRKIEQDEGAFNDYIDQQALPREFLKAKLCGRWFNGARVLATDEPATKRAAPKSGEPFNFEEDREGFGCPFGAHIRRVNPRTDHVAPARMRPIFRRGMPYGSLYSKGTKDEKRGLLGLFFCASIEDQFEIVMSQWVENNPMGPPNRGNAKDPLVGRHDEDSVFRIPRDGKADIELTGFQPFVTTRGTAYALFPSSATLRKITRVQPDPSRQGAPRDLPYRSPTTEGGDKTRPADDTQGTWTDNAPSDRFCDIVMEGGVTSGIIYASAVSELAKSYRFNCIGGSSIGAFAAALAAAAEYSRRRGSDVGFKLMSTLPNALAEEDDKHETLLFRLFKPQKETRRLFNVFVATLNKQSGASRLACGFFAAIRQYGTAVFLAVFVLAVYLLVWFGPLVKSWFSVSMAMDSGVYSRVVVVGSWVVATVVLIVLAAAFALLLAISWDVGKLVRNGFGLCRGWSRADRIDTRPGSLDLAGYLHASIQEAAGRNPIDDKPLTFADLHQVPGGPVDPRRETDRDEASRSISLQVYSTNLAHGRPYRFPSEPTDDMGRLFFRVADLESYFPAPVLTHLRGFSEPYQPRAPSDPPVSEATRDFRELPTDRLPIVVAARLAMSFPLLISAVPLWAIDYEAPRESRGLSRCWMSDGGLCSNFPIHLFDSFVPRWPTFGISLQKRGKYHLNRLVWLPDKHYQGRGDTWDRFAESKGTLGPLSGFLVSLWLAAWRWNDMTMMRIPGVRDRVVRIFLEEDEGGVNIKMPSKGIQALTTKYGKPAAAAFIKKFAVDGSPGWPEHRWVRFNVVLTALRRRIEGIASAMQWDRHTQPLSEAIADSLTTAPLRGSHGPPAPSEKPLCPEQATELERLLAALAELEKRFEDAGDHHPYDALPRPIMRVRHPT
jgi:deferrochelatase/peroxidase EfeB/predicted acylesterase/phospholipase RssA